MADQTYVVVAPCVIVKRKGGHGQTVYSGGVLPSDALDSELERFLAEGYIKAVGEDEVGGTQTDVPGQTLADLAQAPTKRGASAKAADTSASASSSTPASSTS